MKNKKIRIEYFILPVFILALLFILTGCQKNTKVTSVVDMETVYQNKIFNDSIWTTEDFKYSENTLLGFSDKGLKKVKRNRVVVLPGRSDKGNPILEIDKEAFCAKDYAVDYKNSIITFDENSQTMNEDIKYINCENKPLEGKELDSVDFSNMPYLERIGEGAFAGNHLKFVDLNSSKNLTTIENFAFTENELSKGCFKIDKCVNLKKVYENENFKVINNTLYYYVPQEEEEEDYLFKISETPIEDLFITPLVEITSCIDETEHKENTLKEKEPDISINKKVFNNKVWDDFSSQENNTEKEKESSNREKGNKNNNIKENNEI